MGKGGSCLKVKSLGNGWKTYRRAREKKKWEKKGKTLTKKKWKKGEAGTLGVV